MRIQTKFKSYKWKRYMKKVIDLFKDVKTMPDLGKSLKWPDPPPVLKVGVVVLDVVLRN